MAKRGRSSSTERSPKTRSVVAKRRTIPPPPPVKRLLLHPFLQDYADFYENRLYYTAYNSANSFLFDILQPILQSLTRDLLRGVLMRWEENKPVGSLLPSCVEVRDHVVILPAVGSSLHEDKDYQNKFREAVEAFLGFSGTHHVHSLN
ncbi:uncharacterized protein LOC133710507 [Rosa rugosa]|uniref:uncharacterized protein LOC133710507 n=1 Tax=Rosa rugosa TaxID=74645 RepID=UPI002B40B2D4|nr:uncharacterized protein LOC133710507 [Rosa rugosa]